MSQVEIANKIAQKALSNMMMGLPAKLTKREVSGKGLKLMLEPTNYRKLMSGKMNGKGVSITLTDREREYNGEGLKEVWEKVKEGAKWVKDKVVDTPFYQQNLRPLVRKAIETGITLVPNATAQDLLRKGVEETSGRWGAWGVKGGLIQTYDPNLTKLPEQNITSLPPQQTANVVGGQITTVHNYRRRRAKGGSFLMP
jgi:hypothetical protein